MFSHQFFVVIKWAAIEALRDAWPRGVVAAAVIAIVALALGASVGLAFPLALVAGILVFEIRSSEIALGRRLRCLEDLDAVTAMLGEGALQLPVLGGWTVETDFARLIIEELRRKPRVVVECGSGTSTVLIASLLRSNGVGKLHSIEHDALFADIVRAHLEEHGLSDWVELHPAPLTSSTTPGAPTGWYDLDRLPTFDDASIDLLVVDGPPVAGPLTRLPALTVWHASLTVGGSVLLDDGRRSSERRVAVRWAASHPDLHLYWIDTVKGTWKLVRTGGDRERAMPTAIRRLVRAIHPRPAGFGRLAIRR